jgi:predicted RNase H-like HicB family nuclease
MTLFNHLPLHKTITLQITRQEDGSFHIISPEIPEFQTVGETLGEALTNSFSALALVDKWYGEKKGINPVLGTRQNPGVSR